MPQTSFDAVIDYEDQYVQPLILKAIQSTFSPEHCTLISALPESPVQEKPLLQIQAYESLDFERALGDPSKNLINAYVIRKALIRKHYLSNTIWSWTTKHPDSVLKRHFKPAVDFELDYAEFLDDALVEAYELRAAFEANEGKEPSEREWWILKPGMSDRGQGIRLFSSEEELRVIFEEWEEGQDSDDDNDDDDDDDENEGEVNGEPVKFPTQLNGTADDQKAEVNGSNSDENHDYIITSHLRHFIAQPYIHNPLLIPQAPYNNRKFHIRTYVVAVGALRVYVYKHMLALFASAPYRPPWDDFSSLASDVGEGEDEAISAGRLLQRMRDVHLTNTCVQSAAKDGPELERDNVYLLSSLPLEQSEHYTIKSQIAVATGELFRAAVALPTHFQPLPCAFELFGLDFLVESLDSTATTGIESRSLNVQLLEVNAFPDFAQTGDELREVVVQGLFDEVARQVVEPFFSVGKDDGPDRTAKSNLHGVRDERLTLVLDVDLGRR